MCVCVWGGGTWELTNVGVTWDTHLYTHTYITRTRCRPKAGVSVLRGRGPLPVVFLFMGVAYSSPSAGMCRPDRALVSCQCSV